MKNFDVKLIFTLYTLLSVMLKKHFIFIFKDFFNIVLFNSGITKWKDDFMFATPENKAKAVDFVRRNANAGGGTNIKMAYSSAFDLFDPYIKELGMFCFQLNFLLTLKVITVDF